MDQNHPEPMAELTALLGEITEMPAGPERDKKWEEAYALFAPTAEELSILGGQIRVLAERNQNGETLKSFMKNAGVDSPIVIRAIQPQSKVAKAFQSGRDSIKNYWDRKKGKVAVGMTILAATFIMLNYRNVKMLNDFTHENNLVGLFEDWLGMTTPEDEEDRETPLNWRELEEEKNV